MSIDDFSFEDLMGDYQYSEKELRETVMPFGKYSGEEFDAIPADYFDWLVGQDWLNEPLKSKVEQYLQIPYVAKELE
jgi:uncharacterized protein (DUF3820 family)